MKVLAKGEIAAADLAYEVDLDGGKLKVAVEFDAAAELQKLEDGVASPLLKSLIDMGVLAIKEL